ncbi:LysE/ArgO family amino acid transporter [Cognatishimia sp. MH4019]|uniref:LysE/ArgO family amino acid transporter n=1 Tax=Cognatishimia sp. MH4019 TaxID=2854030 RepID=UPI001CD24283|nr:LysE/ArgO family amino acid transporter [Cognatishimia sp. MH4019]
MSTAYFAGFFLGLSLILAIGAQNAFLLRQGLRREHVLPLVLTCALSDAVLIAVGVSSFGALSEAAPWIGTVFLYGGVAFLLVYGAMSFARARKGGEALKPSSESAGSVWAAVGTCLAITWLNPHVYLDTVVMLGSISAQYDSRLGFALGGMSASFVFFFALGYGARLLAPVFANPRAWQVLEIVIGCVMWAIAAKLLLS